MTISPLPPRVLTIAGSDSGGGAGIQADLKTMCALGCYGMSAITAVTAQNTVAVADIQELPPICVSKQIDAVAQDIGVDAAKTGMLSSSTIIEAVAESVRRAKIEKLVVDPVMVSKSGDALLREEARNCLAERLLPLAMVLTPNVPEAEVLTGLTIEKEADLQAAAEKILALGPAYVLMKGGHLPGEEAVDWLFGPDGSQRYAAPRKDTKNTHGTGCTFSAAIACYLARGATVHDAVAQAKTYLNGAIANALPLGQGHGPLHHLWNTTHTE
jgi:hydroxymethylpyrimidine/phosphomethylpyrimidine kinase